MSALYQNHRPRTFDEVRGQEAITTTLKNQVINNRLAHAYLFCGVRGTGKTSVARILAKAVNCENPKDGSPCGECGTCKHIDNSLNIIEIDAASNNGVDDIRQLSEETRYRPTEGKYRVYIIDEVHMLSTGAFNALLKTLEEPPEYVIFILATTEKHKVPATITSRCQCFDFKRISVAEIENALKAVAESEGYEYEEEALNHIARVADGSMRDALSILDRCLGSLTYRSVLNVLGAVDTTVFSAFLKAILQKDVKSLMEQIEEMFVSGKELSAFVNDFICFLRDVMMSLCGANEMEKFNCSTEMIINLIKGFSDIEVKMKKTSQKRIALEAYLITLTALTPETKADTLRRVGNGRLVNDQVVAVTENPRIKLLMSLEGFTNFSKQPQEAAAFLFKETGLDVMFVEEQDSFAGCIFKEEAGRLLKNISYVKTKADVYQLRDMLWDKYKEYLDACMYAIDGRIFSCGHELVDDKWV